MVVGLCTQQIQSPIQILERERGENDTPIRGRYRVGYYSIFSISLAKYDISVQPGTATLPESMKCDGTRRDFIYFNLFSLTG